MNGTGHFYLQRLQIASGKPAAHNLQIVDKIKLVWTDCGADKPVVCNPKAPKKPGLSSGHSRQKSFHGITSYLTAWQKEHSVKGCMILKTPKDNLFNRLIWIKQNIERLPQLFRNTKARWLIELEFLGNLKVQCRKRKLCLKVQMRGSSLVIALTSLCPHSARLMVWCL